MRPGLGGSTLRGGQTVLHSFRMWGQVLRASLFVALFCTAVVPVWHIAENTKGYDWYAAGMATQASAKLGLGYPKDSRQELRLPDGSYLVVAVRDLADWPLARAARERLKQELYASARLGGLIALVSIALLLLWFRYRGQHLNRARRLRGAELVDARELCRRVLPPHRRLAARFSISPGPAPYLIAGVPYPTRTETQHTIVSGTTGSGKTVLISDLVAQIRARGERCVIYDKMGSYTRAFFDSSQDVLLNPLDARSPRWSPFLEARNAGDFDTMAAALIPQQKDTVDPFWVTAARQLFANGAAVLRDKGMQENRILVDHLLKTELTALAEAMEGTVAQSIVDPANPKTALSVRAMLTANLSALDYLPDDGPPFSIRDWISNETETGSLFLTSRGDQHASLRGLISTWLEIAVNAMLSLEQRDGRRIWVILDELPTLHQVPSLQPGLAESRQFGGCFVLGVQVISALRDLYGRNGAETISGLCGTRAVLAAPDRDTAQWSADSLGRTEVEEVTEGFSYGANTIRDGVSLTPRRELRTLALASEIMRLENLTGYLRFPGPFPAATVRLDYTDRPAQAKRFVPRDTDRGADRGAGNRKRASPGPGTDGTVPASSGPGQARNGHLLPAPYEGAVSATAGGGQPKAQGSSLPAEPEPESAANAATGADKTKAAAADVPPGPPAGSAPEAGGRAASGRSRPPHKRNRQGRNGARKNRPRAGRRGKAGTSKPEPADDLY
ncbi:MAG: type IV secretion system DNA-binding domain-containing protein [Rhodospirillaceae bacterium]|nr:type IV secretion system DNA-binding domain-containing protein [Rhodospirillaceae bacterium]